MATLADSFKKAGALVAVGADYLLVKAKNAIKQAESDRYALTRKAVATDVDLTGYNSIFKEKPSMISFEVLRQMAEKDMVVAAIIGKIVNRVAAFAQPQQNKYMLGFQIVANDEADKKTEIKEDNPEQDKEISSIVKFLMNTGDDDVDRKANEKMTFETFLRLIIKDRLIYNQVAIECIPKPDGEGISYFLPVSGGSIRYVSPLVRRQMVDPKSFIYNPQMAYMDVDTQEGRMERHEETQDEDILYAQVYKGQIYALFTEGELIYRHGVPSIELCHGGYAPGELEILINTVANHRIAEAHNERFFRFGYANNGILNIKADVTEEDLQAIKRQFQRQYQGLRNAFKMPILASKDGVEWINTGSSNRDMEWSGWMDYLIKLITAVYGMNPAEINFDVSRDNSSSLGDGGRRNEVMLRDTRNSSLRSLLKWIEGIVNNDLLPRFNPDLAEKYSFEFVGLDYEDKDAELDRIRKQVTTYMTINEVREQEGLSSIEHGDIILDATYLSAKQGGAMAGGPEDGGGPSPEDASPESPADAEGAEEPVDMESEIDSMIDEILGDVKKSRRRSQTPYGLTKVEWYAKKPNS